MTDSYFFDTDCLSSFLWVDKEDILLKTCDNIIIPESTYDELSSPSIPHLKNKIDNLMSNGKIKIQEMNIDSEEFSIFQKLTMSPDANHKSIGDGEAASIALSKVYNGVLASNNLKDIKQYIDEFQLKHITTGDILKKAYDNKIISENEGNVIWANMIKKRRKIGAGSFSEYLQSTSNTFK